MSYLFVCLDTSDFVTCSDYGPSGVGDADPNDDGYGNWKPCDPGRSFSDLEALAREVEAGTVSQGCESIYALKVLEKIL